MCHNHILYSSTRALLNSPYLYKAISIRATSMRATTMRTRTTQAIPTYAISIYARHLYLRRNHACHYYIVSANCFASEKKTPEQSFSFLPRYVRRGRSPRAARYGKLDAAWWAPPPSFEPSWNGVPQARHVCGLVSRHVHGHTC